MPVGGVCALGAVAATAAALQRRVVNERGAETQAAVVIFR